MSINKTKMMIIICTLLYIEISLYMILLVYKKIGRGSDISNDEHISAIYAEVGQTICSKEWKIAFNRKYLQGNYII